MNVNIQKDNEGKIWVGNKEFYVDGAITTSRDLIDLMTRVGKEILPEEIFELYAEILFLSLIHI